MAEHRFDDVTHPAISYSDLSCTNALSSVCRFTSKEDKALNGLIELKNARQIADDRRRRWFSSTDMDLIVWYDEADSVVGFEFYYDKMIGEHVLIWTADHGFAHLAVDDGEQKSALDYKQAPILIPDGHVDKIHIRDLFESSRENLPSEVAALVSRKLMQYPDA